MVGPKTTHCVVAHHNRSHHLKDYAVKVPDPIRRIIVDNRSKPEHVEVLKTIDAELWDRPNIHREAGAYCEYLDKVLDNRYPRPEVLMLTQDDWGATPMSQGWATINWDKIFQLLSSGVSVIHQQNAAGYTNWKPDDIILEGIMNRYFGKQLEGTESILTATFICLAEPLLNWYEIYRERLRRMMFRETRFAWFMERLWQQPFTTGRWVQVYDDGSVKVDRCFENGKPHGNWKRFTKTGDPISDVSFDNGKPHGDWKYWHNTGKLMCSMSFDHGRKIGKETGWNALGEFDIQVDWDFISM